MDQKLSEKYMDEYTVQTAKLVIYRLRVMVQGGPLAYDAIAIDEAAALIEKLVAQIGAAKEAAQA